MKIEGGPRVYITPEAKRQLDLYIKLCDSEISGLGRVISLGDDLLITEVFIFEQEVTSGSTNLNAEALSKWLVELIEAGHDPVEIKLWWHSHGTGTPFWSSTDSATASQFANNWMLSLVGNKQGKYKVRLDLYEPFRLTVDDLPLEVHLPGDETLRDKIEAEIEAKVHKLLVTAVPTIIEGEEGIEEEEISDEELLEAMGFD